MPDPEEGGGMFAIRLDTGQRVWQTPPPARAARAIDAAPPNPPR